MSDKTEPTMTNTDDKTEKQTSTPVRLFGQFKQNGNGFSSFGQLSSNGDNSTTSYFTSTLSKLSSTNGGGGGFGTSSTSLAASLAPLTSNATLFGASNNTPSTDAKPNEKEEEDDDDDDDEEAAAPSLLETAAEYEAKRASTHPTANIQGDTSTGEEHEVTKFQMAGKLYVYNSEQQQFVERGYGILKINESHDSTDWNKLHARIIMRLDKAFRVILNSPIFPKMTVDRATDRSVRFGAQDESQLRIFVIKSSPSDCTNLCKELQSRIEIVERQQTPSSSNVNSPVKDNLNTSNSSIARNRKRSHSQSDSDSSENTNDLSKKTKTIEGYRDENQDTSDDDSVESVKTGEQETTS